MISLKIQLKYSYNQVKSIWPLTEDILSRSTLTDDMATLSSQRLQLYGIE